MKLMIATAISRIDAQLKNKEITWEDFLERAKATTRTPESVSEYKKLPKNRQDDIKDVGGFVAGKLTDGKRRNGSVEYRSMLTLDMDYAAPDAWEQIKRNFGCACCLYSTHKHAPDQPRFRLNIPLTRNVSADEYMAVARRTAEGIDIEQFDDSTYGPARLMYWASTSNDGEFVFESQSGDFLDPDVVLSSYKNWRDASSWPVSSRQKALLQQGRTKQANPLEKEGLIGAFCRTYSIQAAIEKFLPDIYLASAMAGRYDYIPADSSAGVVIYDNVFAYSHHATDPVCGMQLNAFDLVRLHKFGDLDERFEPETAPSKLPSFKEMQKLCVADAAVKMRLAEERQLQAARDFAAEDWQLGLTLDKKGDVQSSLKNLILILENDQNLKPIVFNQLGDNLEIIGPLPWTNEHRWWRDADDAQLVSYIDRVYGSFTARNYDVAVTKVADDRAYHPLRSYLAELPEWDGSPRVDTLLIDYLGAADNPYIRAVTRKTLCAAAARVYSPGCKFDTILVLNGPQGIGKSTLIAKLGGEWFSDSLQLSDTHDKTAAEKLQGYWILEIGELAGLRKAEVETLRSFLSRQNDIYRASFGRRATPHPRQCVFIGTTNAESGYLRDTTGNRRFWPVKVSGNGHKKTWALSAVEVEQIWAEVLVMHKRQEPLFLDPQLSAIAAAEQRDALEDDDREALVREYLEKRLPENWAKLTIKDRVDFINGWGFQKSGEGTEKRSKVCINEIWVECFGKNPSNIRRQDGAEIHAIMVGMDGWEKYKGGKYDKLDFRPYGVARGYVRIADHQK